MWPKISLPQTLLNLQSDKIWNVLAPSHSHCTGNIRLVALNQQRIPILAKMEALKNKLSG